MQSSLLIRWAVRASFWGVSGAAHPPPRRFFRSQNPPELRSFTYFSQLLFRRKGMSGSRSFFVEIVFFGTPSHIRARVQKYSCRGIWESGWRLHFSISNCEAKFLKLFAGAALGSRGVET
jgi:hypothetical protein